MEDDDDEFLTEIEAEYRVLQPWGPFDPPPGGTPPFRPRR